MTRTQQAQNEITKLQGKAQALADDLAQVQSEQEQETAALAEALLNDSRDIDYRRSQALGAKRAALEAAQTELQARLEKAQVALEASQMLDARDEISQHDKRIQAEYANLLPVAVEWYARLRTVAEIQARVGSLQTQFPGIGSLHDFAMLDANGALSAVNSILFGFLGNLTERKDESPAAQRQYAQLWEIFYAAQAQENKAEAQRVEAERAQALTRA